MNFLGSLPFFQSRDSFSLSLPDISQIRDLQVGQKDQCLDELQKLGQKRDDLIHNLGQILTLDTHTLYVHRYKVHEAFKRAQELREQIDYCLNQYVDAKPSPNPQENSLRLERIWNQIQIQDADEAGTIHKALRNGWIKAAAPSAASNSLATLLSVETVSGKVARFAKANWMTVLGFGASAALSLNKSLLPEGITSLELYSASIPAILGTAPLFYSLDQTTLNEAADFGLAIGRAVADSALPGAAAAAITGYCYDPENSWVLPLLGTATIVQLGSIYCNMPSAKALYNHALTATEKWFEYGGLTGVPMAIAATATSCYFEQSFLANAGWMACIYALHAVPAAVIAASKP